MRPEEVAGGVNKEGDWWWVPEGRREGDEGVEGVGVSRFHNVVNVSTALMN